MKLYRRLAQVTLVRAHGHVALRGYAAFERETLAGTANSLGEHARAKEICESALRHVTDEDRESVALFLELEIQLAHAQAGVCEADAALARIDGLLARFCDSGHPMALGGLHEARARIAWKAGLVEEYVYGLTQVERLFVPTGTPALVSRYERLSALRGAPGADRAAFPRPTL